MPQALARISFRRLVPAAAVFAIIFLISSADAQVVTTVNGQPITEDDIQQRSHFHELATHKTPDRQDIIDELSKETREIAQAQRHGIAPSDAEVMAAFENVAMNMNIDSQKLTKILTDGGVSTDTLMRELRAQLARSSLAHGGFDDK